MMQAKNQQVLRSSELKHFRLSLSQWILEGRQVGDESILMFALRVYDVKHALNQYLNIPISICLHMGYIKRELRQDAKLGATHRGKAWTKATKAVEDVGPRL